MGIRHDMRQLTQAVHDLTTIRPQYFFELGSRDGHDTHYLANTWKIQPSNCFIFEAHTQLANIIQQTYPYHTFNVALGNETKRIDFYAGDLELEGNVGMSSALPQISDTFKYNLIEVDMWRFDEICSSINIEPHMLDLFKVDVEGWSYEVLVGFGSLLSSAKAIQIELELVATWQNQKLFDPVYNLLNEAGFIMLDKKYCGDVVESNQLDCLFVHKDFVK